MRPFSFICALVAMLFLACCGGDTPKGGTGTAGGAKKYAIGAVLEKSGDMENWGDSSQKGIELAVQELKGKDGIELEMFIEDNKSTPEQSANAFISLANVKNVLAVIGSVASSHT